MKRAALITGVIVASLAVLSLFSELPLQHAEAQAALNITIGNASVGISAVRFSSDIHASRFALTENGTMQSISIYFSTSRFHAKTAIYTDVGGKPGTLITQSMSKQIDSVGWHTFALPQNSLSVGYYWFAVTCSSSRASGTYTLGNQTSQHCVRRGSYSREFRNTFGTPNRFDDKLISIYGTFAPRRAIPQLEYGIYWNQGCTNSTTLINWGTVEPGTTKNSIVYVRNEGKVPFTLAKSFQNWNPLNAATCITLAWDYTNSTLMPGNAIRISLTLVVSPDAQTLGTFSFDTEIAAIEASS